MDFPDKLDANARVGVRKGTGTTYERRRVSFLEGTNVSFTVADDPTDEEVDVTVAVASAAPSGSAGGALDGTYPNPGLAASVAGAGLTETSDVLAVGAGTGITVNANDVQIDTSIITLGAWTDWTPTVDQAGDVTVTVTYAKYRRIGRSVRAEALLTVTGSGTGANVIVASIPTAAATASVRPVGSGHFRDATGPTGYPLFVIMANAGQIKFLRSDATGTGYLGTDPNVACANGDLFWFSFEYEAAS